VRFVRRATESLRAFLTAVGTACTTTSASRRSASRKRSADDVPALIIVVQLHVDQIALRSARHGRLLLSNDTKPCPVDGPWSLAVAVAPRDLVAMSVPVEPRGVTTAVLVLARLPPADESAPTFFAPLPIWLTDTPAGVHPTDWATLRVFDGRSVPGASAVSP